MAKEKIIDNLCALALTRYRNERRGTKVTKELKDAIYYSVLGVYTREGEESAYNYVKTAKLLG